MSPDGARLTVNLVKPPTIYIAGTINHWNSDPDHMVRACMNDNGPEQEHGWINPSWSMWTVWERRKDAGPAETWEPEFDENPESPEGDLAHWLAKKITSHIGAVDSVSGNVFYAADAHTDLRHDQHSSTHDDVSLSAIVKHVDDETLARTITIIESSQCIKITGA